MGRRNLEVLVGVFVVAGLIALGYLSIKLGKLEIIGGQGYDVTADFTDIGGLKTGATVEIGGVEVGRVTKISLGKEYQAVVNMRMDDGLKLSDDTIASIKTKGLIGEKFVQLSPGGSDITVKPGGLIRETESAIDIENLISNYIFGKV